MKADDSSPGIVPLARHQNLTVRTAALLREAIVDGTLAPGMDLKIPQIAKLCGVSATPVREALIHLTEAGLVSVHPQGIRIATPSKPALAEAFEVRECLEGMTARLAAQRRSEEQSGSILELANRSLEAADNREANEFRALDAQFHLAIVGAARSSHLERYARNALDLAQTLRNIRPAQRGFKAASAHLHVTVAEAIANQDPDGAEAAMRTHVREVLGHILEEDDPGRE
ncbi:GntR family transcriptional regulator [Dactylosporangium sp. CA-052675]|uniref:GntR family transcriptional regulator n=1 Tax=Dactylosporangium sp. CA-052675 TaxID=3239927 RepID=UPI003D9425AE